MACDPSETQLDLVVVGAESRRMDHQHHGDHHLQAVFMPKIGFLSTDKIAIAYRDLNTGAVYVAIQN